MSTAVTSKQCRMLKEFAQFLSCLSLFVSLLCAKWNVLPNQSALLWGRLYIFVINYIDSILQQIYLAKYQYQDIVISIPSIQIFVLEMQSSDTKQSQGLTIPVEISLYCPGYYKDSVLADLFEHYCEEYEEKTIVICGSIAQASQVANSQFFIWRSTLVHSDLDRRERIRLSKCFQIQEESRCLITNNIGSVTCRQFKAKLIVFLSPPKNKWVYNQVCNLVQDYYFIVVCYNTEEIQALQILESELNRKFIMITPPDVQSEPSYDQYEEEAKVQQKSKQLSKIYSESEQKSQINWDLKCEANQKSYQKSRKPYTPIRTYQSRQQAFRNTETITGTSKQKVYSQRESRRNA